MVFKSFIKPSGFFINPYFDGSFTNIGRVIGMGINDIILACLKVSGAIGEPIKRHRNGIGFRTTPDRIGYELKYQCILP